MEARVRKNPVDRPVGCFKYCHVCCTERRGRLDRGVADIRTNQQRGSQLCALHLANALAGQPRSVLPASGKPATALGNHLLTPSSNLHYRRIAIALRKQRPYLITGWLWYLGMLVPVIGVVQVGWQGRADRYTYLPQIGLYMAVTWAVADMTSLWRHQPYKF